MSNFIFTKPKFNEKPSAWIEHIPFAFFIIEKIKPQILVELGTHFGNSYFAFCQAIAEIKLNTKAYAVDQWTGDEHAGHYGPEVFEYVDRIHSDYFAGFSNLMKMTFDEAQPYFSDQSIDLLHIDGMHSYQSVRHDFENWLPKMSDHGVILLHDTNVRENGFGVWKLMEEIRLKYPSLEFTHGHGLGMVCVGKNIAPEILEFVEKGKNDFFILQLFASLGKAVSLSQENNFRKKDLFQTNFLLNEQKNTSETLNSQLIDLQSRIDIQESTLLELDLEIVKYKEIEKEKNLEIDKLCSIEKDHFNELNRYQKEIENLKINESNLLIQLDKFEKENQLLISSNQKNENEIQNTQLIVKELENEIIRTRSQLADRDLVIVQITNSFSWKYTKPFRMISESYPEFKRFRNKILRKDISG